MNYLKHTDIQQTELIELFCRECQWEMRETGKTLMTNPVRYEYKCSHCGKTTTAQRRYPLVQFTTKAGDIVGPFEIGPKCY